MDELPPTLGAIACDWMETYLVHGPGDIEHQPFRLDDEKRAFVYRAYEYRRAPDSPGGWRRRYRRAVLSRRKGFAKSELAAGLSAFELLGPARLDGFDAHGQPVGRPVKSPNIPMAATSEDQAEETLYGAFKEMVGEGEAANAYDVDITNEKTTSPNGKALVVTSSSSSRDGGKPTFTPFDETHLWFTPQLLRTYRTMRRNLAKLRAGDPWSLETTTSFQPGEGSVAEASYEYGMKVLRGEIEDAELLFDHLEASWDHDISTPEGLRAAILEASGEAAPWTNVPAILDEFADPGNDEAENRRYWLNQIVAATNVYIAPAAWRARAAETRRTVEDGTPIVLGFDGSRVDDATALWGCTKDGYLFPIDGCTHGVGGYSVWEKPDGELGRNWRVPVADVNAAVNRAFERFHIVRFYPDPPWWQDEVATWQATWGDVVMEWWTNRPKPMHGALERLETAVGEGAVSHDGNPVLERHMGNARKEPTNSGYIIRKPAERSVKKIDAAMAAVLAYEARGDALASGEFDTDDSPGEFYAF